MRRVGFAAYSRRWGTTLAERFNSYMAIIRDTLVAIGLPSERRPTSERPSERPSEPQKTFREPTSHGLARDQRRAAIPSSNTLRLLHPNLK